MSRMPRAGRRRKFPIPKPYVAPTPQKAPDSLFTNEVHNELVLGRRCVDQEQSPLFNLLPAEVRTRIFRLALADYESWESEKKYDTQTVYARPGYFAPRRTDTALLLTCKRVYRETWVLPLLLREHTFWLTAEDRRPDHFDESSIDKLTEALGNFKQCVPTDEVFTLESMHAFAQMCRLECDELTHIVRDLPCPPRSITITVRHTDWWWWESNEALKFDSNWMARLSRVLPAAVQSVTFELETLEHKRVQLDDIVQQMTQKWYLRREDNVVLFADVTEPPSSTDPFPHSHEVSRWQGSSTLLGNQWTEQESAPGRLDYYVVTVVFQPEAQVLRQGGQINEALKEKAAETEELQNDNLWNPLTLRKELPRKRWMTPEQRRQHGLLRR